MTVKQITTTYKITCPQCGGEAEGTAVQTYHNEVPDMYLYTRIDCEGCDYHADGYDLPAGVHDI